MLKKHKICKKTKPCVHKTSFGTFKSKTQKIVLSLMVCCLICLNILMNTPKIHSSKYIIYWHRIQIKTKEANKYKKQTSLFIARKLLHGETWRKMDDFSEDHPPFFSFFFPAGTNVGVDFPWPNLNPCFSFFLNEKLLLKKKHYSKNWN